MSEIIATLRDAFSHMFTMTSIDGFLAILLNILNEFGDFAAKFFAMLP